MNIFTIFFYKILAKYSPKRAIFKNFLGKHAPEPPSKRVATPTFPKIF